MVMGIFRIAAFLHSHGVPMVPRILYGLNRVIFAVVLPPSVKVGKDVVFGYQGLGTVIHARAVIEDKVVFGSNVTVGGRSGSEGVPVIGEGAYVGTGARVLGPIRVGKFAVIGANAVVIKDVPDFGVVAGVPAKLLKVLEPSDRSTESVAEIGVQE